MGTEPLGQQPVRPGTQTEEHTMAATKKLANFTITEAGDGFSLHIEDEAGRVLELSATREQMDLIADTLDDFLEKGDDADEVKD
jgi:hypothetical protein